jgi:hypothetical protein
MLNTEIRNFVNDWLYWRATVDEDAYYSFAAPYDAAACVAPQWPQLRWRRIPRDASIANPQYWKWRRKRLYYASITSWPVPNR